MTKYRTVIPFRGVRDGECHPVDFNFGDEVAGSLADAMREADHVVTEAEFTALTGGDDNAPTAPSKPATDSGASGKRGRAR